MNKTFAAGWMIAAALSAQACADDGIYDAGSAEGNLADGGADGMVCELEGASCATCADHLAQPGCGAELLCESSAPLHEDLRECVCGTCFHACGDHCQDKSAPVSQECAACVTDFCEPSLEACANDI